MTLEASSITVRAGGKTIVDNVSFTLEPGEKLMIVGPNGAGKTTLVRAVMNAVPHEGTALLNGRDTASFRRTELARHVGMLTQSHSAEFGYLVRDVVSLGRYAWSRGAFGALSAEDGRKVGEAMELTGTAAFSTASIRELSGGELQRVFLAQLFAQDPDILILDEPTNNLDLAHQINLFDIVETWAGRGGKAVIAIIHDLNLVYRYSSKALLMHNGARHAYGPAEEALSNENLNAVYGVDIAAWMHGLLTRWERRPC